MSPLIISTAHSKHQAQHLADEMGLPWAPLTVHRFPDGEFLVTIPEAARNIVIYASLDHPNEKLVYLLFATQTLRDAGTKRIALVAPYMCYMRQDHAFAPGQAVSQKIIGEFLDPLFDRIVTVDPHLHRTASMSSVFPNTPVTTLSAAGLIADHLIQRHMSKNTLLLGPDEEAHQWVHTLAKTIGIEGMVAKKTRSGDRDVSVELEEPERLRDRPVIIIDDVISSGQTIVKCARAALASHAASVDVVAVHALHGDDAASDFARAGIASVISTDSIPHPTNKIKLAPLLAGALASEART